MQSTEFKMKLYSDPLQQMLNLEVNVGTKYTIFFFFCFVSGFLIYFGYGIRKSNEREGQDQDSVILYDVSETAGIINGAHYR